MKASPDTAIGSTLYHYGKGRQLHVSTKFVTQLAQLSEYLIACSIGIMSMSNGRVKGQVVTSRLLSEEHNC